MNIRPLMMLLILGLSFTLSGCDSAAKSDDVAKEDDEEEEIAVPVEVQEVTVFSVYAAYNGTSALEADQEANVVAKTNGIILELLVEEGDSVVAGQVVARLDHQRLALELQRAAANLRRLENDYKRNQELHQKDLISSETFEKSRYDMESQSATYDLAKLEFSYAEVRSPIAGVISERLVKVGNLVNLYEALFRVDSFDPLLAVIFVPERELSTLRTGQIAILTVDAIDGEEFVGNLARISPVVDPKTGTFKVTVEIVNPDPRLKPGMFGRVNIVHDTHENAITVSQDALILEDQSSYVYLIDDDRVKRVDVVVGYTTEGRVEIVEGLQAGQRVVTSGKGSISDNTLIEIINDIDPVDQQLLAESDAAQEQSPDAETAQP